jgi:acetylxylan esterase
MHLLIPTAVLLSALVSAQVPGTLTQIANFAASANTTSRATLHAYLPRKPLSSPPTLITAVHHCHGSGTGFFASTPYRALAEKHGFVVLFPGTPHKDGCWDVSSPASLRYAGGGDSSAIADMMRWAMKKYGVKRERSFVVGVSSGAMMTVSSPPFLPPSAKDRLGTEKNRHAGLTKDAERPRRHGP